MAHLLAGFLPQVRFYGGDDTDSARDIVHDHSPLAMAAFATEQAAEDHLLALVCETVADCWGGEEDGVRWERDGELSYDGRGGGFWFRVLQDDDVLAEGRALVRTVSLELR